MRGWGWRRDGCERQAWMVRGCGWRKRGVCEGGVGGREGVRGCGWKKIGVCEGGVGGRAGCERVWLEEERGVRKRV